jgi:hypothetical protein
MIGNHRAGYYWHVNLGAWFAIFLNKFWTDDGLTYRAKFFRWLFTALLFGGAFAGLMEIYGPLVPEVIICPRLLVMPAKAGIQSMLLDPRFRGGDAWFNRAGKRLD